MKFLIIILLFWGSFFEKNQNTDWDRFHLHGKVKKIKEISFKAIDSLGVIVKGERDRDTSFVEFPEIKYDYLIFFNRNGYIEKEFFFNSNKKLCLKKKYDYDIYDRLIKEVIYNENNISLINDIYKYDKQGNKIQVVRNSFGKFRGISKYIYDDLNRLVYEEWYDSDTILQTKIMFKYQDEIKEEFFLLDDEGKDSAKIIYKYDSHGNLIEKILYMDRKTILWKENYSYDEQNNLLEKIIFDKTNTISEKENYSYDNRDNLISRIKYDNKNNIIWEENYSYNDKNNLLKKTSKNITGSIVYKEINEYIDYDKNNNWTLKIKNINDTIRYIIEREYDYW